MALVNELGRYPCDRYTAEQAAAVIERLVVEVRELREKLAGIGQ